MRLVCLALVMGGIVAFAHPFCYLAQIWVEMSWRRFWYETTACPDDGASGVYMVR